MPNTPKTDLIWQRDEIESPCVKLCVIDQKTNLCLGCHRTINEITAWSDYSPTERADILIELPKRKKSNKPKRRGGRKKT